MQQKKNTILTTSTANGRAAHTIPTLMKRITVLLALIVSFALGARAADYVITYTNGNNTYFLGQSTTPTTSFVPNASIYTGNSGSTFRNANGYYIRYNNGLTFNETTGTNFTINNNNQLAYDVYNGYYFYYLNFNNSNSTWRISDSNNRRATASIVETETIITEFTISGDESISTTGTNNSYTHTNATYYYVYEFNEKTYYSTNPANAASTNVPTSGLPQLTEGYTWSISNNSYATVNPSTGAITVNSLPTTDTRITLTCSVTHNGKTQTVNKDITIIAPKIEPTSIIAQDLTLAVDDTGTIVYDLQPSGAYRNVTFSVADATIATVNANGVVTGIKAGTTTVTLTAKKLNGETSPALTTTINVKVVGRCATPIITIDKSTGSTTITCSTEGATIYYTTDGSDPTTSSTVYNGPFTVTKGTVVKAMATKSGFINSAIASQKNELAGPTGVSGGVVTLNDLEDHTWTYYSGVNTSVDGGNYNDNYAGKLYSPNPRNVKITYKANGGAVSIDESETSFVYFKTLEQGATAGQYPYTVISNPFSKRPIDKGFGGWKIISGGEYINGYNNGNTLPLDQEITFVNLPYPSVNCISAEIELEATWVNLNNIVRRTNTGDYTYTATGGTYETNILVLKSDHTGTITVNSPCTIMMVEPDGSDDFRDNYAFSGYIVPMANGNTKIEFARWRPGNDGINPRGRNFTIGRGMVMDGTRRALYGTDQREAMNQILKVESGNFSTFTSYNVNPTSITKHWVVFGCDYDRAKKDNNRLTFTGKFITGEGRTLGLSSKGEMARVWSKSGSFMTGVQVDDAAADNSYYVGVTNTHNNGHRYLEIQGGEWYANIAGGMGENHTATDPGFTFRMKGGIIRGSVYGAAAFAGAGGIRTYVITGGTIGGWVAGGANGTQSSGGLLDGTTYIYVGGKARVDSKGSTSVINRAVGGNVFGAGCGNGTGSDSGEISLGTNVVIADEAYIERGVYGGGSYGFTEASSNLYITGGRIGGVAGGVNGTSYSANIPGGVYGGACQNRGGTVNIYMTDGEVNGGLYGGSNNSGTIARDVTMQINGGQVGTSSAPANIHGGGYGQSTIVTGNVNVTLGTSGQTSEGVTVWGDIYGGSALGKVNCTVNNNNYQYTNNTETNVTLYKGTINGSLYGGALGGNNVGTHVYGPVKVKVYGGSVKKTSADGSGGVYGANNKDGAPQRSVTVDIYGTDPAPAENQYALHAVYGGGNQAPYTYGNGYPRVTVHNCDNSIEYVYGGGNAAAVKTTNVTIWGGNVIGNVFGGGHGYKDGAGADVEGDVNVAIKGGTIKKVFGGSNSKGNISGTIKLDINKDGDCDMRIGEVYGGGNEADGNAGTLTIGCTGALVEGDNGHVAHPENIGKTLEGIGAVYGGANNANVTNDSGITLNINSGMVANAFGGNNTGGDITGGITVNINKNANTCGWYVGNVYGAGNLAQYSGSPAVNILNGEVSGNVYGGGKGDANDHSKGQVTGNPTVTIGDNANADHTAIVIGDVYGGGDAGNVVGIPVVNVVNKCNTSIGNVYGGGNAADVNGTDVNIDGGTITGMVFGGGHGDKNADPQTEANVNGNVNVDITGGTINKVFGGSNSKGNITGTIALNIEKADGHCDMRIAEVYGGGNEADGNAGSLTIGCTGALVEGDEGHLAHPENIGKTLEGIGAVYGGANNANIGNDVTLNINSGMVAKVFGGNNTGGIVNGNVTVNVNKSANTCGWYVGKVHGGGYGKETNVAENVTVNIENGTIYGDVYGGSALGKVNSNTTNTTKVNLTGGIIKGDAYGGGLGDSTTEADVNGNVIVTLDGTAFELTTTTDDKGNKIPTSGRIFGCNNINGSPKGTVLVKVLQTVARNSDGTLKDKLEIGSGVYELQAVYGGGNLAAYNPKVPFADKPVQVVIDGCGVTSIEYVYGGGNAAATPATDVTILGSHEIASVFGGGNGKDRYTLDGGNTWNENKGADVGVIDAEAYATDKSKGKYGTGNAMTSVLGGTVHNIYGGSNMKGNIVGEATAYLDAASGCPLKVDGIYGGGNEAKMDGSSGIQLGCIKYLKEIYGGARNADVGGDINLTITSGHFDRIFGGNNLGGAINGSITVNIEETGCNPITIGELYGCGNKAAYSVYGYNADGTLKESGEKLYSDPVVNIRSFTSIGNVYGGGLGEEAVVTGNPTVNINVVKGANNEVEYNGNTIDFGDDYKVTLPVHEKEKIGAIGTVFGGGNAAKVIGNTNVNIGTEVSVVFESLSVNRTKTVEGADIRGNVYGGGNKANVTGKTNVKVGRN